STLAAVCYTVFYFFYYAADPDLHSFPTRRSSDLGDAMPPSVEAVAARRPDLVVLYRAGPNLTAAEQLERLGIRTVLLDLNLLEQLGPAARRLGVLTGHSRAADSLVHVLDNLASQPAAPRTPSL